MGHIDEQAALANYAVGQGVERSEWEAAVAAEAFDNDGLPIVHYPLDSYERIHNALLLVAERNETYWVDEMEDVIIAAQEEWIRERFGDQAMVEANYCAGVASDGVSTKVYGQGWLSTDADGVTHSFTPFPSEYLEASLADDGPVLRAYTREQQAELRENATAGPPAADFEQEQYEPSPYDGTGYDD